MTIQRTHGQCVLNVVAIINLKKTRPPAKGGRDKNKTKRELLVASLAC